LACRRSGEAVLAACVAHKLLALQQFRLVTELLSPSPQARQHACSWPTPDSWHCSRRLWLLDHTNEWARCCGFRTTARLRRSRREL